MSDEKWAYVSSKLGNVTDKALKLARETCEAAWAAGHDVWFMWGDGQQMDHKLNHTEDRPVLDWMVHTEAAGDFVRNYLWEHRERHGLKHVLWEQHITSTVVQPGVRRKMADRGSVTANHYDHVHSEHFGGGYVPLAPPPAQEWPTLRLGSNGETVRRVQLFFKNNFPGYARYSPVRRGAMIDVDGDYGRQTVEWIKEFQRRTGLTVDGEIGPLTWAKLREHGYK